MGPGRWLMLAGAVLVLLGILARRWASRYDLKDAALDSVWTLPPERGPGGRPAPAARETRRPRSGGPRGGGARGPGASRMLAQGGQEVALGLILVGLALAGAG